MRRFVDVAGGRLLVVDDGEPAAPPVVLVHSALLDHTAWDPMVAPLVEAGFRAVRYDMRGWGESDGAADVESSDRADLIAVLDALGIERAAIVGNSRGGTIAIDTAVEYPDRVAALVAVACDVSGYQPPPDAAMASLEAEFERLSASGDEAAQVEFELRLWVDGPGQPSGRANPKIREAVRQGILAKRARGRGGPRRALEPPANARLSEIRCPALAIAGDLDIPDCLAAARRLEEAVPRCRLEIVPGVAHLVGLEAPDILARLIVEFLGPQTKAVEA